MGLVEISRILIYVSPLVLLVGIGLNLSIFRSLNQLSKCLVNYLIMALVFQLLMTVFGYVWGNNLVLIPLYGFFELLFFTYLYARVLMKSDLRNVALLIGGAGLAFITYECFTVNYSDARLFHSYARAVDGFCIVVYTMFFFFEKLSKGTDPGDSSLVLNTTVLIFFSLNLIFLLPLNFLINEHSNLKFYFLFGNMVLTILFHLVLIILIWKNGKTPKPFRFGSQ